MHPEPVDHAPRQAFPWAVLRQRWEDLTFLHWAVAPEIVAPLLPAGTRPDTTEGQLRRPDRLPDGRAGLRPWSGVPYFGTFWETNVRLYSVDDAGRRAVVFRSLDASRLLPVLVARVTLRLPYLWSSMRLDRDGDRLSYRSRRRWPGRRARRAGWWCGWGADRRPDPARTLRHRPVGTAHPGVRAHFAHAELASELAAAPSRGATPG
ncbi:DUF2071 domain-containing protein [Micromonospora sp. M12]